MKRSQNCEIRDVFMQTNFITLLSCKLVNSHYATQVPAVVKKLN